VNAAIECLKRLKLDASKSHPYAFRVCIGFGIGVRNGSESWDVKLGEFAKLSPELKAGFVQPSRRHDGARHRTTRLFLNGFSMVSWRNRSINIRRIRSVEPLRRLEVAGTGRTESRGSGQALVEIKLAKEAEERQVLHVLDRLGFPSRKKEKMRENLRH